MYLIKEISLPSHVIDLPPGSVAVLTNFYAGLFGGPFSQLLKCLAAVKICEEYKKRGTTAVPVCLVCQDVPSGFSPGEINLADRNFRLHCLKAGSFEEIEKIFPDGDREALSALKEAFIPNKNFVSSCVQWLKYLMKDYGVTILEYNTFMMHGYSGGSENQSPALPVAAFVADSAEITKYDETPLKKDDVSKLLVRLCPDVTISNARCLKTLKRYGLDFARLFDGNDRVMDYVRETLRSDVPGRLQILRDETGAVFDEMENTDFAAGSERSGRIRKARAARIIYQLEKIQRHSRAALANKEKAAENRIGKACDFLAPLGRRQQDVLGGAQIPVSYGLAGLRALYNSLEVTTPNRQLIEMN